MKHFRVLTVAAVILVALLLLTGVVVGLGLVEGDAVETAVQPAAIPYLDQRDALRAAVYWLVATHQNEDGGYSSFSSGANEAPSSVGGTVDALLAIGSAGYTGRARFPGKSAAPVDYLGANEVGVAAYAAANGGQAGKLILALTAAGENPRVFWGHNYVISLTNQLSPTGQFHVNDPFNQSLAMLGLAAAREPIPASAVAWLLDRQAANGSWDDGFGTDDNVDATGMAMMALAAAGISADEDSLMRAREFLAEAQLPTGGWPYAPGIPESANSTAIALQALKALGEAFFAPAGDWAQGGNTPLTALLNYQNPAGGFEADFGTGPMMDFFATVQSIPAVTGKAYPLPARLEGVRQALSCLDMLQDTASGGWEQFAGVGVNAGGTARAIEAIAAVGGDPQGERWTTAGGINAVEALAAQTPAYVAGGRGGRTGIVMQGVVAAGPPYAVTEFAGLDLVMVISDYLSPTGEYDHTGFGVFAHAEAMLGLAVSGHPVAPSAVEFLLNAQENGNWGSDDANGIALQVLSELELPAPAGALATLHANQTADGGWGFDATTNPSATSEVVQGLVGVGENPFAPAWSVVVSGTVMNAADALLARQEENGCWPNLFGPGADPFSTTDAIVMLAERPAWGSVSTFSSLYLPVVQP